MSFFSRSVVAFAIGIVTLAVACGGATEAPSSSGSSSQSPEVQERASEDTADDALVAAPRECAANPPPNARCAAACPHGYAGPAGTFTCECCAAPSPDGEVCGGPPPNARCKVCPKGYKQIDGRPSCECCSS